MPPGRRLKREEDRTDSDSALPAGLYWRVRSNIAALGGDGAGRRRIARDIPRNGVDGFRSGLRLRALQAPEQHFVSVVKHERPARKVRFRPGFAPKARKTERDFGYCILLPLRCSR